MKVKFSHLIITFLAFIIFTIAHNAIYALFGFEEAVFFLASLISLLAIPILLIIFIIQKLKPRQQ